MTAKQKMTIAITALCLVAVIAIVTVIAVFAATTAKINSAVNVSYTATDVVGTASAKWYGGAEDAELAGENMDNNGSEVDGETVLNFDADSDLSSQSGTLSPAKDITFDASHQDVIFEYKFTNSGSRSYKATVVFTGTIENVTITSKTQPTTPITVSSGHSTITDDVSPTSQSPSATFTIANVAVAANTGVTYVYVKLHLTSKAKDATFSGTFAWTLTADAKA